MVVLLLLVFFFSSRRRHTRLQGDWSSDVCSSDLSWRVWQVTHSSAARRAPAGTSLRFVEPQRVQTHSAVVQDTGIVVTLTFESAAAARAAPAFRRRRRPPHPLRAPRRARGPLRRARSPGARAPAA